MSALAVDTSVAVPLLLDYHDHHAEIWAWWRGRRASLCGQAWVETYSVVTRLPPPLRLEPDDAAQLMAARFAAPLALGADTYERLPQILAERQVAGGAVYDAMVALTAVEHRRTLATRDGRARGTYETMGADVEFVG